MLQDSPAISLLDPRLPTVWGLDPIQLHDRYWASRGVFVVRPQEQSALPPDAHLFMLTDSRTLALFAIRQAAERLFWVRPTVLFIRLRGSSHSEYREVVREDGQGRFVRFERQYNAAAHSVARIAFTCDRRVAEAWQGTDGSAGMWREFRRQTRSIRHETLVVRGHHYDRCDDQQLEAMVTELVKRWRAPSSTVEAARELCPGVWGDQASRLSPKARVLGGAWVGVGRSVSADRPIVGPAVLWDDPQARPVPTSVRWDEIEPAPARALTPMERAAQINLPGGTGWRRIGQRIFDIAFASLVLLLTLPIYPLIMLAIWLEDGRPFFFGHLRETVGGREFRCLKFRTMRKDADSMKAQLASGNQSDGPQFFIENDPRVTRVGRLLRKTNLDELPQFINVLRGEMSVVGPRPSPRKENQFCPAWREARLSVRPGITGLWQVSRTRRQGLDFQEWIRFDVEYVEHASWRLDLIIILKTLRLLTGV
jgi:lipopolysaccharide/colanic/teichoic acid biosynthesis glycosyltransferase